MPSSISDAHFRPNRRALVSCQIVTCSPVRTWNFVAQGFPEAFGPRRFDVRVA
jgi:hypothetical protein